MVPTPRFADRLRMTGAAGWCCLWLLTAGRVTAQLDFESEPILYNTATASDPVAVLQDQVARGEVQLKYDERHGYLKDVLTKLEVPISSQMLVFSKTSFQQRRITPSRPRAVYFNDDVYVGWVQGGDVVEISSADPHIGAVFYTIGQEEAEQPRIQRDRGQCIVCHASSRTAGVPGHLVRSVFPDRTGQPFFGSGTFTTDHRSPFEERWGGWYVTGTHGQLRHMGNVVVTDRDQPEKLDIESGANVTDLSDRLKTQAYLSPHSDIVALMVLEHQSRMHNLITLANFETRSAEHYDTIMNKALDRPVGERSESAGRRIAAAAEKLVDYMLFVDELPLTSTVKGTSKFASEFAARGPRDGQGRSLREFDLSGRMMKYPCSYLIYSKTFDHLPLAAKQLVYQRLFEVLSGKNAEERFAQLTMADRQAILEILRETKSDLPSYWNAKT